MSEEIKKEINAQIKLTAIEILNTSIIAPISPDVSLTSFNFNINLENKVDAVRNLVFVIVGIEITTADLKVVLGSFTASCIFTIENFSEVITLNADNVLSVPEPMTTMFNSISISTIRGVMFGTFKGTFLHNAILPIVNPSQFRQSAEKAE